MVKPYSPLRWDIKVFNGPLLEEAFYSEGHALAPRNKTELRKLYTQLYKSGFKKLDTSQTIGQIKLYREIFHD